MADFTGTDFQTVVQTLAGDPGGHVFDAARVRYAYAEAMRNAAAHRLFVQEAQGVLIPGQSAQLPLVNDTIIDLQEVWIGTVTDRKKLTKVDARDSYDAIEIRGRPEIVWLDSPTFLKVLPWPVTAEAYTVRAVVARQAVTPGDINMAAELELPMMLETWAVLKEAGDADTLPSFMAAFHARMDRFTRGAYVTAAPMPPR